MMFEIPYGKEICRIEIPDHRVEPLLSPESVPNIQNDIDKALGSPVKSPSFKTFLKGDDPLLVIVNDATRPTPTAQILETIQSELSHKEITFLIATGTHGSPDEKDLKFIFGSLLSEYRKQFIVHDSKSKDDLISFGTTSYGTSVHLNCLVQSHQKILVIGSVEPHYFAGYTGGRKAFLPGVAGYDSIEQNHKLAMEEGVNPLALEGNPVHQDMDEVLQLLQNKNIFSIQTVLDEKDEIHSIHCGDIRQSFNEAVQSCHDLYALPVQNKVDIILSVATPPLDATLYQAHKAVENVRSILNPGGILILSAGCQDGTGADHFIQLLQSEETPDAVLSRIKKGYHLGYHKAARLARFVQSNQLWVMTSLDSKLIESIFFKPVHSLQSAVNDALTRKPDGKILIVPRATVSVPVLSS